jgi:hypothetical protein
VKFRTETITPDRARRMMDQTERLGLINRSIRRARVEQIAHAIRADQWRVTHQGIALSAAGAVLDGQHRLLGIILADREVDMVVARDVEEETYRVIDTGTARTTGDSLKIAGYTSTNHLAAVVRGYLAYEHNIGTTESYEKYARQITTADVLGYLDDPDRSDRAVSSHHAGSVVARQLARYGLQTALGATILLIRSSENELGAATVAEFFARLGDGVSLAVDSPILALRRWYTSDTGYARVRRSHVRTTAIACTIKALNDYALGRPRTVVGFRVGSEPLPAPLPKGSRVAYERALAHDEEVADKLLVGVPG